MEYENVESVITTELGEYKLTLITQGFLYYVNEDESDENGCVIMKNLEGKIISDNYFAYGDFMMELEKIVNGSKEYEYIDERVLEMAKEYYKN